MAEGDRVAGVVVAAGEYPARAAICLSSHAGEGIRPGPPKKYPKNYRNQVI